MQDWLWGSDLPARQGSVGSGFYRFRKSWLGAARSVLVVAAVSLPGLGAQLPA